MHDMLKRAVKGKTTIRHHVNNIQHAAAGRGAISPVFRLLKGDERESL